VSLQTEMRGRVPVLKTDDAASEMGTSNQQLLDPCQILEFRRDRSKPTVISERFWGQFIALETLLTCVTDRKRSSVDNTLSVNHDVGFVECRNAGFEIERDDSRVDLKKAKGSVVDRYRRELAVVVIDAPT
jgi:hypothetical protein